MEFVKQTGNKQTSNAGGAFFKNEEAPYAEVREGSIIGAGGEILVVGLDIASDRPLPSEFVCSFTITDKISRTLGREKDFIFFTGPHKISVYKEYNGKKEPDRIVKKLEDGRYCTFCEVVLTGDDILRKLGTVETSFYKFRLSVMVSGGILKAPYAFTKKYRFGFNGRMITE